MVSRTVGVVAVAVCGLLAFLAFAETVLDLGAVGLPSLGLAVSALAVAVVFTRRDRAGAAFAVAVVAVPLVLAAMLGGAAIGQGIACSDGERQVLSAISHVAGAQPGIAGDLESGGCIVRYTARADEAAVVRHYSGVLGAAGWRLNGLHGIGSDRAIGELYASRDGLRAWVSWSRAGAAAMRIVVSVND